MNNSIADADATGTLAVMKEKEDEVSRNERFVLSWPFLLGFVAVFIFYAALGALWSYP